MPCYFDGNGFVICTRKKLPVTKCYKCNRPATLLCDGGNSAIHTCDKPMCERCANTIGKDNHVCDEHFNELNIKHAISNREQIANVHKSLYGFDDFPDYICPQCKNEEHSPNAKYCRICGLKIEEIKTQEVSK